MGTLNSILFFGELLAAVLFLTVFGLGSSGKAGIEVEEEKSPKSKLEKFKKAA